MWWAAQDLHTHCWQQWAQHCLQTWAQVGVSFALLLTLGSQEADAALSSIDVETYRTAITQHSAGEQNASKMQLSLYVFMGMRRDHASDCQNQSEHVRRFQTRGCHTHPVYCKWILLLIKSFLLIIYSPLFTGSLILEAMLVFFFTCLSEWLDYNLLHKEQVNWCQSDLLHRWSVSKGPLSLTLAYWEDSERCWAQFIWSKIRLSSLSVAVSGSLGHWLHAVSSGAGWGLERRQLGRWTQKSSVKRQEAWMVRRKGCLLPIIRELRDVNLN